MRMSGYLLIGIVTGLSSGTASAETHHGALCHASGSDVTIIGRNRSGAFNDSTTTVKRVNCPGTTNGTISRAIATVFDRSPSSDVDCTVGILSTTTGNTLFTANDKTTGFASAAMGLDFGTIGVAGAFVMQCNLPPEDASNGVSYVGNYTLTDSH